MNYIVLGAASEPYQKNGTWYQKYRVQNPVTGIVEEKEYWHNGQTWILVENYGASGGVQDGPIGPAGDTSRWSGNSNGYSGGYTQAQGQVQFQGGQVQGQGTAGTHKIDLVKSIPNTAAGINLKKSVVNLDKCLVDLSKKSGINMQAHTARVAVVMDFSGSMTRLYRNGDVQEVLNRLVPLALRFDDNGELDFWLFHSSYRELESVTLNNFETYIDDVVLQCGERFGGTQYAPVLEAAYKRYFSYGQPNTPVFMIFITDGDNSDKGATNRIIREGSTQHMFIQFVGIGDSYFDYLEKLDDLTKRAHDNTGFIKVSDFKRWSDEQLYSKLLEQYIPWLKEVGRQ